MAQTKGTIKAKDMVTRETENLFSTLDLPTLHMVADFFGAEQQETIAEQVISLAESGVTYAMYAQEFKIPLPDDYVESVDEVLEDEPLETVESTGPVTVARTNVLPPQQEYLIKMTRKNPYFEVASVSSNKKFKFTTEHPYAVMDAKTAQFVLEREEGFRQAFPDELRDFYED